MYDDDEVAEEMIERDELGRFPAGVSGNPRGRPADYERLTVVGLSRLHTKRAVEVLLSIMENAKSESARVRACEALLNRGWGMPTASLNTTVNQQGHPSEIRLVMVSPDGREHKPGEPTAEDLGLVERKEPALPSHTAAGQRVEWIE